METRLLRLQQRRCFAGSVENARRERVIETGETRGRDGRRRRVRRTYVSDGTDAKRQRGNCADFNERTDEGRERVVTGER